MTLSPDVIDGLPHVEGVLNYLAPMAETPMNLAYEPPPGVPRSTGVPEPHRVMIYDARQISGRLSLDSEGLAVVKHNSAVRDFYDEDELRRVYYPEAERLVAKVTGATRVLVFDHTVRRRVWGGVDRSAGTPRQPVTAVHNDYTINSGPQRVRDLMGPAHRWFYVPEMQPDEAILIKCYDSATDKARFTAHSAFEDPTAPAEVLPRESIELRTLIFHV